MKKIFLLLVAVFCVLFVVNFASALTNVSECNSTHLNTENEIYELNVSINSSFDCLIINATNITLDCKGYNITYGNASGGWGVSVVDEETFDGYDNVTIKNCKIIQNQSGANESAIFFGESSENGIVYNNTILIYGGETYGVAFDDNSTNANITLNNITTSGNLSFGIYLSMGGSNASIKINNITTSGNTASGIVISDDSTNVTISNNRIITHGDRDFISIAMGGIVLDEETSGMNVSSNNITTFGADGAGIWIWGSNSSIANNIITTSGELGDGIYLNDVQWINLTSNTITLSGENGDGIHSEMSENSPLIFYKNVITTSGNYSYGINLDQNSNNNISSNNITTSGNYSHGIYFSQSHNTILANNVITTGKSNSYVLYLITSANETVYNNLFNTSTTDSGVSILESSLSYFNTTNTTSTNIIGKTYTGGNFWTNNESTGFSDNCLDSNGDYFCDSAYALSEGTDYLPLTNRNNLLSSCGTLSIQGRVYYLNQSITVNGTCINITANDITLNLSNYIITGNTTGYGINISSYNYTEIIWGTISNFSNGIYVYSSSNNAFTSVNINNSKNDAILLEGATSGNNNFTSVVVANTNASYYDINFSTEGINGTWIIDSYLFSYTFAGAGGKVNFKVSDSAIIEFLEPINGSGTNLTLGDINVEDNLVFVNSSSNSGLNKSANITLYSISYTDPKPQYSSDGVTFTDCTTTTDPACSELGFSGNAFKFNTTHFTYFRAAEAYSAPSTLSGDYGSSSITSFWNATYTISDEQFKQGYTKELPVKSRIKLNINNSYHYIGVVELTNTTAKINVSSSPQQATFLIGNIRRFDVTEDDYYDIAVTLNGIANNKANITIKSIFEEVTEETEKEEQDNEIGGGLPKVGGNLMLLWILIAIIIIFILSRIGYNKFRNR